MGGMGEVLILPQKDFSIHLFANTTLTPLFISPTATDREKKIAQHAKAKREAEKRRGTSKFHFLALLIYSVPECTINILEGYMI